MGDTEMFDAADAAMDKSVNKGKGPALVDSNTDQDLPWVEKYRPSKLDELVSHDEIVRTISKLIDQNQLPHLLFYGPPGTGKTSTILAVAQQIYGPGYKSMVLELNASDARGIDVVRNEIKTFASTQKMFSTGFKLIILDEADAMTKVAQNALRRVIEKYTRTTRFCLICNYVSSIIPALQSRCTRFRFAPLSRSQVEGRLNDVIAAEGVNINEDGRKALLKLMKGDMRRCLNILQSTHMAYDEVTADNIYMCTGNPLPRDVEAIVQAMLNDTFDEALRKVNEIKTLKGLALQDLVTEVTAYAVRIEFPARVRAGLVRSLADLEHRLATAAEEKLHTSALVGIFFCARRDLEMVLKQQNAQA